MKHRSGDRWSSYVTSTLNAARGLVRLVRHSGSLPWHTSTICQRFNHKLGEYRNRIFDANILHNTYKNTTYMQNINTIAERRNQCCPVLEREISPFTGNFNADMRFIKFKFHRANTKILIRLKCKIYTVINSSRLLEIISDKKRN